MGIPRGHPSSSRDHHRCLEERESGFDGCGADAERGANQIELTATTEEESASWGRGRLMPTHFDGARRELRRRSSSPAPGRSSSGWLFVCAVGETRDDGGGLCIFIILV